MPRRPKQPAAGGSEGDLRPRLVLERRPIASLEPAAYNPRTITPKALAGLGESLKRFGLVQPVVWNRRTGRVVGGHQRLKALAAAGETETDVAVVDLPEDEERALNVTLNSPAISGEFTPEALPILDDLALKMPDLSAALMLPDLRSLLAKEFKVPAVVIEDGEVPSVPARPITELGDLIFMGPHRLACGDCRDAGLMRHLLDDGRRPACIWTDPPYGVEYVGKTKKALKIQGDGADGLAALLDAAFRGADAYLLPNARWYIAAPAGPMGTVFRNAIEKVGWRFHQALVWVKDVFVLGHSDYHYRHEDVLYGWKPGPGRAGRGEHEGSRWYGDHAQDTVLEVPRPKRSEEHPTMKPVELVARCLRNSTRAAPGEASTSGDVVLDLFTGSGSTLLACEALGLAFRGCELEPGYADVAVARWEAASGQKARRVPTSKRQ